MWRIVSGALSALLVLWPFPALSQTTDIPPLRVLSAAFDDSDAMRRCGVSYSSAVAQAMATVRYNGVPLANQSDTAAPTLWIWLHAITPRYVSGRYDGGCSVMVDVEIMQFAMVLIEGQTYAGTGFVQLCSSGESVTGTSGNMTNPTNDAVENQVNQCLAEARENFARAHGLVP